MANLQIFDQHMNVIKNELFKNIAEMNGLSTGNVPQTQRTKLVKVQDSLVLPSPDESNCKRIAGV